VPFRNILVTKIPYYPEGARQFDIPKSVTGKLFKTNIKPNKLTVVLYYKSEFCIFTKEFYNKPEKSWILVFTGIRLWHR